MINRPIIKQSSIRDVSFGYNVTVVEPINIYECCIGNNCFIGPFVEIQKGVVVGDECRIQSHSFICEMVEIGDRVVIAHGVMFINDRYRGGEPARGNKDLWERTSVGNDVSIGSNATILPVHICSNVVIGAGAVLTCDIREPGIYAGNPAKLLRHFD